MTKSSESFSVEPALSILLIENDNIAALVAINIFEQLHCQVEHVKTGEEALQKYKSNKYHLIMMDIGLSKMDGLNTTKKIRLYETDVGGFAPVPIIGLSGIHEPFIKSKCFEAGMNNLITKPLTLQIAQDIINEFIIKPRLTNANIKDNLEKLAYVPGKILDINVLFDLIEKNKHHGKIKDMVDEAINRFEEKKQALEFAHQQGDWHQIYQITLQLSGESAYYGMERLKLACEQLMENINSLHHDYIETIYAELLQEITLAKEEYLRLKEMKIV